MTRIAYSSLAFTVAVLLTAGCTRSSLLYVEPPDAGTECNDLGAASCAANPSCEFVAPCACGQTPPPTAICLPRGTTFNCPACPACVGLDEAQCKGASSCRADYCSECSCTPTFVGCVAVGAPASACPAMACPAFNCDCSGLDEQSCSATTSCTSNYCVGCNGVEAFSGCTGPNQSPPVCSAGCGCRVNGDCSGGQICAAPGQISNGGPCSSSAQCPALFDCVLLPGSSSSCERRACGSDGDCGGNAFCVDGGCYDSLGRCQ